MFSHIDAAVTVDKDLRIIFSKCSSDNCGHECAATFERYLGRHYSYVFLSNNTEENEITRCFKTGQVIVSENQSTRDIYGNRYRMNKTIIPIIRFGEVIAVMELSHGIIYNGERMMNDKSTYTHFRTGGPGMRENELASLEHIVTTNAEMLDNINKIKLYAFSDEPVLIYGETGTGKELFAEAIVREDPQRSKRFVTQNCAAIPENLFESLLFGSTKGSFTGAENKVGLFELADKGFLFLDELNSMPLHMQAKLLRVIQDCKIRPVGSSVERNIDVKIIAAVNKNPLQLIKEKQLREDLFYRLSGKTIYLSPLRDRKEDIPVYIDHFIDMFNNKYGKQIQGLDSGLEQTLLHYWWPGNVRELRHVVESMVSLADSSRLSNKNLPTYLREILNSTLMEEKKKEQKPMDLVQISKVSLKYLLENTEKEHISKVLDYCDWNITTAADMLNMPRQTLRFRMDKLGIKK